MRKKRSDVKRAAAKELVADQDTTLTVTYPEQVYSPVSYNSFRVGGVTLSVTVPQGEKVRPYFRALQDELEQIVDEQFERVSTEYADRIQAAADKMKSRARG